MFHHVSYIRRQYRTRSARMKENRYFKRIKFVTAVDLSKSLKQMKLPMLINTCAPISELSSNLTIMYLSVKKPFCLFSVAQSFDRSQPDLKNFEDIIYI